MSAFAGDAEPQLYCLVNKSSGELKLYYGEQQENAVLAKTDGYYPLWGGEYGNSTITKVIIDASIADYPLTSTKRWFREWSNLSEIDGLTYLNTSNVTDMESMFQGCSKLKSLDLSGFDTKNVTNMSYMFDDCSNLEVVYVGENWNTSSVTSSKDMFYGCEVLYGQNGTECLPGKLTAEYAHIDDGVSNPGYFTGVNQNAYKPAAPEGKQAYAVLDGTELTFRYDNNMPADAYALKKFGSPWPTTLTKVIFDESFADYYPISCDEWFYCCYDLNEIVDMEKYLNTDEVLSMHRMFKECSVTEINLSHFNTEKVTDMSDMFGCWNITTLDVSKFKTENVTDMSDMFGCSGITTLDVSGFNTAKVTDMSEMFRGCSGLKTLDVSGLNTANVTDMSSMFYNCSGLTTLDLSKFNTSKVTDMSKMFNGCENLTTLDLSSFNTSKVTDMSGMFLFCPSLTELDLSSFNTANVQSMDLMFFVGGMGDNHTSGNLTTIYVSDNWSTESLLGDATMIFSDCKLVGGEGTSFEEQEQLATTEELRMRYRSKYFARVDGGEDNPGYLTYKAYTQEDNREAYAVFDNGTLTFYYDANKPEGAYGMRSDNDNEWGEIANDIVKVVFDKSFENYHPKSCLHWFSLCHNLEEIVDMEKYLNTEDVTNMDFMFNECFKLKNLNLSNFHTENLTVFQFVFQDCESLTVLDLSSFNTSKVENMCDLFRNCKNLKTIYVGNDWSTESIIYEENTVFFGCLSLFGGKGTRYDGVNFYDQIFARVDGGPDAPGYLTKIGTPLPVSVDIKTMPTQTSYLIGDERININGGEILVTYSDNSTNILPFSDPRVYVASFDNTIAGEQNANVYFCDLHTTFPIMISEDTRTIKELFIANEIQQGTSLYNITLLVYYTNEEWDFGKYLSSYGVEVSGLNTDNVGLQNVTITYKGYTWQGQIEVYKPIASLDFSNVNTIVDMKTNEQPSGIVTVVNEDETTYEIDIAKMNISEYEHIAGVQEVTVSYRNIKEKLQIMVLDGIQPEAITIETAPKTEYIEGEDFSAENGVILITYNNGKSEKVELSKASITGYNNTKVGKQLLKVSYLGLETELNITITANPESQNPYTEPEVVDNVYQISSASELLYFMFDVNNGNVSANAVLLNDIVVNADLLKQIAELLKSTSKAAPVLTEWQPIGTAENAYKGTFDGNGHTISGIYIKDETQNNVGLFGNVAPEAVIKNLGVTDSYIAGNENVGAICGKSEGTVVNCYTISEVKGSKNVNPLVGAKETAAVVENCYYLAETPVANDPCAKTAEEFLSGNVAQLLSQGAVVNGVTYSGETFAGVTELPGTDIIPQPENNDNPSTPISSISENNIKVWSYNHTIYIENAPADTKYTIIDLNGRIITTSTTKSTKEEINTNKSGIMILNIDNQSFKITQ